MSDPEMAFDSGGEPALAQAHGVLVDVLDVGVLLLGPSGIGKSECALELVTRGHRLIADDVVRIHRAADGRLRGSAPELIRHYMEIRGIGLLHIPDLYGPDSVCLESPIDLICHLERWRENAEYERVGLERPTEKLTGVELPSLVLPVRPASSMATLVEAAARDHHQRAQGTSAAERFDAQMRDREPIP